MSEIIVYDRITDPIAAMNAYGDDIAKSGLLGCSNTSQGRIMAMECFARRTTAISLAQQFHIVDNKLSMKADAMLAELRRLGGKHKVIQRDPTRAEIEITCDGETQRFAFSWEEACLEPFVYNGKRSEILKAIKLGQTAKLELNPNYASPRKRMQMLWARVASDGVRTMMPEVNFGRYAPEELEGDDDELAPATAAKAPSNGTPRKSVAEMVAEKEASAATPASDAAQDAEFEPVASSKATLMDSIRSLWLHLGAPADMQQKMTQKERCGRPGAAALVGLDVEQLTDLEQQLKEVVAAQEEEATEPVAGAVAESAEPSAEDVPFDIDDAPDGPISDVQLQAILGLIETVGQVNPDVIDNIGEQLHRIGKTKITELSAVQANVLIDDLRKGDTVLTGLGMYIAESLAHYATAAGN